MPILRIAFDLERRSQPGFRAKAVGKGMGQWMHANMPAGGGLTVPRANLLLGLTLKSEPTGGVWSRDGLEAGKDPNGAGDEA